MRKLSRKWKCVGHEEGGLDRKKFPAVSIRRKPEYGKSGSPRGRTR